MAQLMHRSGTNPGAAGCSCLQAGPCPRKDSQAWLQEPVPASPGGKSVECKGRSQNPNKNNPPNSHYGAPVPRCAMAGACQLHSLFIILALIQLQLDNLQCRPGNQSTLFTQPKLYQCTWLSNEGSGVYEALPCRCLSAFSSPEQRLHSGSTGWWETRR